MDARREEKDIMKVNPHAKIYYKEGKRDNIFLSDIKSVLLYFLFPSPEVFNGCLSVQSMASESRYRTKKSFISL